MISGLWFFVTVVLVVTSVRLVYGRKPDMRSMALAIGFALLATAAMLWWVPYSAEDIRALPRINERGDAISGLFAGAGLMWLATGIVLQSWELAQNRTEQEAANDHVRLNAELERLKIRATYRQIEEDRCNSIAQSLVTLRCNGATQATNIRPSEMVHIPIATLYLTSNASRVAEASAEISGFKFRPGPDYPNERVRSRGVSQPTFFLELLVANKPIQGPAIGSAFMEWRPLSKEREQYGLSIIVDRASLGNFDADLQIDIKVQADALRSHVSRHVAMVKVSDLGRDNYLCTVEASFSHSFLFDESKSILRVDCDPDQELSSLDDILRRFEALNPLPSHPPTSTPPPPPA